MTDKLNRTLLERGSKYGDYNEMAVLTQGLKDVMRCGSNWSRMPVHMRESLDMIATKIGRVLNGDPFDVDTWHDIAGYAKLSEDLAAAQGAAAPPKYRRGGCVIVVSSEVPPWSDNDRKGVIIKTYTNGSARVWFRRQGGVAANFNTEYLILRDAEDADLSALDDYVD